MGIVNAEILIWRYVWKSLSIDYTLATLSEASTAMCGGILQDGVGLTAEQVSFLMALVALGTMTIWAVYLVLVQVRRKILGRYVR